jgi:hypothetical protein
MAKTHGGLALMNAIFFSLMIPFPSRCGFTRRPCPAEENETGVRLGEIRAGPQEVLTALTPSLTTPGKGILGTAASDRRCARPRTGTGTPVGEFDPCGSGGRSYVFLCRPERVVLNKLDQDPRPEAAVDAVGGVTTGDGVELGRRGQPGERLRGCRVRREK